MDNYRNELKKGAWTWLENSFCGYHWTKRFKKDRISGRAAKRRARQLDKNLINES